MGGGERCCVCMCVGGGERCGVRERGVGGGGEVWGEGERCVCMYVGRDVLLQ